MQTFDPALIAIDNNRLQELVGFVFLVTFFDSFDDILAFLALTLHQAFHSNLDTLPPFVSVHGIVASHDRRNLSVLLFLEELDEVFRVASGRPRCSVASIAKEVDVDVRDALLFGSLEQRVQVRYV